MIAQDTAMRDTFQDDSIPEDLISDLLEEAQRPPERTLLETWQVLLTQNADTVHTVTLPQAIRQIGTYPYLKLAETQAVYDLFLSYAQEALGVVTFEIEKNPACLKAVENDATFNRERYMNIIIGWSQMLKKHDDAWRCELSDAGVIAAAIGETSRFLLNTEGLLGHLGAIGVDFDEDDADLINSAVYGE